MKTYRVLVTYKMGAVYEVQAENEADAMQTAIEEDQDGAAFTIGDVMDDSTEAYIVEVIEEKVA